MFALALAATFDESARPLDSVGLLLDGYPCAPADGRAIASAPGACAGILRWAVVDRDRRVAPVRDGERGLLFVGDVRLYNRRALAVELDVRVEADPSDAEIAWHAYLRWGEDSPRHLVGDFAFVVWDERRRSIFAARDHFGVRPLHYRVDRGHAYVATDVRQLLAVAEKPFAAINPQTMLERLATGRRTYGLTFFRDISALPAGHTLTIASGHCSVRRYWSPSFAPKRGRAEDDHAEIRALFRQAVRDRLESAHPVVAHSSGGVDSSAIVMVADQIYGEDASRPPLVMASAMTLGMPCDDSRYMDAVARRVRFEGVRWNALEPSLADLEDPTPSYPGYRRGIGGGPRRDLEVARERGARVLLHGFFGDGLMYAFGVSRDMLRAGRWGELARYVATGDGMRARARLLLRAMTGLFPPPLALRVWGRIENRSVGRAPAWMGPALRALYPPRSEEVVLPDVDWPSNLACELWARMTSPRTGASIEATVAYGAEAAIEVRLPYLDVRLAEKLLEVPWEAWTPIGDDHRRLNREALGCLLPEEFAQRRTQGSWKPVWLRAARRMLPLIQKLVSDGTWLSAPYVEVREVSSMLADAIAHEGSVEHQKLLLLADFGALEAWLRHLFRYDTTPKERYV